MANLTKQNLQDIGGVVRDVIVQIVPGIVDHELQLIRQTQIEQAADIKAMKQDISGLKIAMDSLTARIENIEQRIESLEQRIKNIEQRIKSLEQRIENLEQSVYRLDVLYEDINDILMADRELLRANFDFKDTIGEHDQRIIVLEDQQFNLTDAVRGHSQKLQRLSPGLLY